MPPWDHNKQANKKTKTASTLKNKSDSSTTTVRACVILGKNVSRFLEWWK